MSHDKTRNPTGYAPVGYPQPQYPPPPPQQEPFGYPYRGYANPRNPSMPPQGTAYYASAQLPIMQPEPNKGYACARIALVFVITFMIASLALIFLTGLIFGRGDPEFQIEAFSVPYFNVADNSTLKASWEANITAKNPSHKLDFFSAEIEGSLVYRGRTVDLTLIDPLHLGINGEGSMQVNFSVSGAADRDTVPGAPVGVLRQMVEDRKSGSAEFDLKMVMEATFSSADTFWRTRNVLRVHCVDIRVNFPSPTGGGTWDGASGVCLTFS